MRIIAGVVIIAIIALVVGCATPPEPVPNKWGIAETQSKQTEPLSYEVVKTYTVEVVGDSAQIGNAPLRLISYPKACVEIKNTGNIAGLFSVNFFFSEECFGWDLIYLKPGETGVATYTPVMKVAQFPTDKHKEFREQTAEWQYEITPIALNP